MSWQWSPVTLYVFLAGVTLGMALNSPARGASRQRMAWAGILSLAFQPRMSQLLQLPLEGLSRSTTVRVGVFTQREEALLFLCYALSLCREPACEKRHRIREHRSG